jgi:hypothetical protein
MNRDDAPAPRLGRREWLRSAVVMTLGGRFVAPALALTPACGDDLPEDGGLDPDWQRAAEIARAYFDPEPLDTAAALGRAYLAELTPSSHPVIIEADLDKLVTLIDGATSDDEALDALSAAIAADFRDRNLVVLSGWTLGRSELRLCALVALAGG